MGSGGSAASGENEAGNETWPPSTPQIEVTLYDYGIDLDVTPIPAGRVVFRVRNTGSVLHRVTLVPLPEDLPPIDEQLAGGDRRTVKPLGAVNPRPPGAGSAFAVDLEEGRRYALICYEEDDEGVVHARKGGNVEFRAGGPAADPPESPPA